MHIAASLMGRFTMARRIPAKLIATAFVPIMLFVALVSWALASPIGASPDEDYHLASIWCGGGIKEGLCEAGKSAESRRVPAILLDSSRCFAFKPEQSASCPQQPSNVLVNTVRGNFDGGYPPLFYATMSVFASDNVSASIVMMRVFNAFLFVSVTTALFLLLPRSRRGPLLWGAAVTLVPLGMFLIPSVNPSSWSVISAVTLWISLVAFFREGDGQRKTAFGVIAFLMTLVGAGSRGDSAVYSVLAMVVALVLTFTRSRRYAVHALLPVALAAICVFFFFIAGQSSVVNPDAFSGASEGSLSTLIQTNLAMLPQLWAGALGYAGLGWLDTGLPGIVWVSVLVVFAAFLFWGLQKLEPRKAVALSIVFTSVVVVPMYILVHDKVLVGAGVQPRYIYPLIIMLAGIALIQLQRDDLLLSRAQLGISAVMLTIANADALHVNIRRYVTGTDVVGANLSTAVEWWWNIPVSPTWVWLLGSAAFGAALLGAVAYSTSQRNDRVKDDVWNTLPTLSGRSALLP
ncbi:DUF2142 domain-containing protein [Cryobacterium algoritolerans]|uniref:DUF2142 domain-containing protein n=1 Tax=Cryobacterium algoritolerans TaxID=1259184 RepID=A0A4R8WW24_9MICO|nr:DUF2142 domain-containing protein [Cryobacterium algoritolerans]TFC19201.1 DUF2142 domain-containing protein [Cryobacterium algoritolerans]